MNKKLLIGATVGAAVVLGAVASASKSQSGPKPTVWDKMRDHMEEMPEDFPPRMMFDNIEAIKANTEEILALLGDQTSGSTTST